MGTDGGMGGGGDGAEAAPDANRGLRSRGTATSVCTDLRDIVSTVHVHALRLAEAGHQGLGSGCALSSPDIDPAADAKHAVL